MRIIAAAALCLCSTLAFAAAPKKPLTAPLKDSKGAEVGEVEFTQKDKTVTLNVMVHNLPAGQHGIHIHAGTSCTAPDFTDAQGHFNPTMKKHGYKNPEGHHAGDMTMNLTVLDNGTGSTKFMSQDISLKPGEADSILGKAIVIHETSDDQMTDPAGASGKRIACGVIPASAM